MDSNRSRPDDRFVFIRIWTARNKANSKRDGLDARAAVCNCAKLSGAHTDRTALCKSYSAAQLHLGRIDDEPPREEHSIPLSGRREPNPGRLSVS